MKQLFILFLFITCASFSNDQLEFITKKKEIILHNEIQSALVKINNDEISAENQDELKLKLTDIIQLIIQLGEQNEKIASKTDFGSYYLIKYKFEDYKYYYAVRSFDTNIPFERLEIELSKYKIDPAAQNQLGYAYNYVFNDNSNLQKLDIKEPNKSIITEYNENGLIYNHYKIVNDNYIGKTYTKRDYGTEIGSRIIDLFNLYYSFAIFSTDYDTKTDSLFASEYIHKYSDTILYSAGYLDNTNNLEKKGEWITYYKSGNPAIKRKYEKDKNGYTQINGIEICFFENGDTAMVSNFDYGYLNGTSKLFHSDNQIKSTENYINRVLNGQKISYFQNGDTSEISTYKDGYLIGDKTSYFENGEIQSIEYYTENNEATGTWLTYDSQNGIEKAINYKDGKLHGTSQLFYRGYSIDSSTFYAGKREGQRITNFKYMVNHDNPVLYEQMWYENNILNGIYVKYYENGQLNDSCFYDNGIKEGYQLERFRDGTLKKESHHKDGETINYTSYFESGKVNEKYNFDLETTSSTDTIFYENGAIAQTMPFDKNGRFGLWIINNEDGELTTKLNYIGNNLVDGFELIKDGETIDSTLYDSKTSAIINKRYVDSKLISENKMRYGVPVSWYDEKWAKKEDGIIFKSTYFVDLSYLDTDVVYNKSHKKICIVGDETSYFLNGNKKEVVLHDAYEQDWISKQNYYRNGTLKNIIHNENYANYSIVTFNKNGDITTNIKEELETSEFYTYYKTGNLESKTINVNDIQNLTEYYPNGIVKKKEETIEYGEYDFYKKKYEVFGEYYSKHAQYYDENGIITKEENLSPYSESNKITTYENGNIARVEYFEHLIGDEILTLVLQKDYYPTGKYKVIKQYELNEMNYSETLVSQYTFYESGGLKSSKVWDIDGIKSGLWIYYNDDTVFDKNGEVMVEPTIQEQH